MRRWLGQPANALFALLLALHLAPLGFIGYFPTQDGPNHIYGAHVLRLLNQPAGALYRQFYTVNRQPNPNWLSHLVLAALDPLAGPRVAEKLIVALYLLLLPLGACYALRALHPGGGRGAAPATALAVLVFPFTLNWMLHMGFYNYVMGLAVLFWVLGYWLRHDRRPRPRHALGLALLSLTLFFCHLAPLVLAFIAVLALAGWAFVCEWPAARHHPRAFWRRQGRRWLLALAGFLPALALAGVFIREQQRVYNDHLSIMPGLWKLKAFGSLFTTLVSYRINEAAMAWILGLGLLGTALGMLGLRLWNGLGRRPKRHALDRRDGLLLVALAWFAAFYLAPANSTGGAYLYHRLAIAPYFALILWLGAIAPPRPVRLGLQAFGAALALWFLAFYAVCYGEANERIEEYVSAAPVLRPHSVILPLCLSPNGRRDDEAERLAGFIGLFQHTSGYVARARDCIDLSDYEGMTNYFPTCFRPAVNPHPILGSFELDWGLDRMDFLAYPGRTGRRIDYVLVWDDEHRQLENRPRFANLRRQLQDGYQLIFTSWPRGSLRVYAPKGQ